MKLNLLVGTMTGTAQLVAQELELVWDDGEVQVETLLMDDLDSSVFANEGVKAEPISILAVSTRAGELKESRNVEMKRVAPASVCYVMNDVLKDVFVYGTAARARTLGFERALQARAGLKGEALRARVRELLGAPPPGVRSGQRELPPLEFARRLKSINDAYRRLLDARTR